MNVVEHANLSAVATLNPRDKLDLPPHEEVSFVPMSAVCADTGTIAEEESRTFRDVQKGFTPFLESDVLVAKITPCFQNGKIAQANITKPYGFGSTEFHVVRANPEVLDSRYAFHFLRQPAIRVAGERRMTGSAGQRRVPKQFLAKLKIPLFQLDEQKRIAKVLDQAEALRARRRAALPLLDELTQAIFLDKFGDPATNPKGFESKVLKELYVNEKDGTKCGPFGSALKKDEYSDSGVPVWNMDNIAPSGRAALPFRMWVPEHKYKQLESYAVKDGDIIISRAGTVGKMCVTRLGDTPSLISTNLIRLRLGPNLLPLYFVSLMTYCRGRVGRLKTGPDGAFTHMNTKILDKLKFPYPPVELQREYVEATKQIDQHKRALLKHLEQLDELIASLQQLAFKGGL